MMSSHTRYSFHRAIAAPALAALVLVLAIPDAHAEVARTGSEPWYQQSTADARQRAQALFAKAIDKHRQLLREDAMELYEQALAQWDNPDIRWNLALVLEDQGQYLRAHQQLDGALRWDAALGAERQRDVEARMQALEIQRLARIEAYGPEPGADIELDGQPWFRGAGPRSALVLPGTHQIASTKPGYFPVSRSVYLTAGQQARVELAMDADHLIETRRWAAWKPWAAIAAGVAVAAVGSGLEAQALAQRTAAAEALESRCRTLTCEPAPSGLYDRAMRNHALAIGALAVGGTVFAVGLALAWLNLPRPHRAEARAPSRIEFTPVLSPQQAELSALVRF
jgi:tetratricopeptide (TPR) repeat protein